MGLAEETAFKQIQAQAGCDGPYAYPSGVSAFCTIVTNGPPALRQKVLALGLDIFGEKQDFKKLDSFFAGLRSNMLVTHLSEELGRRVNRLVESTPKPKAQAQQQSYILTPQGVVPVAPTPPTAQPVGKSTGIGLPIPPNKIQPSSGTPHGPPPASSPYPRKKP
jgi:hypothetical protein